MPKKQKKGFRAMKDQGRDDEVRQIAAEGSEVGAQSRMMGDQEVGKSLNESDLGEVVIEEEYYSVVDPYTVTDDDEDTKKQPKTSSKKQRGF